MGKDVEFLFFKKLDIYEGIFALILPACAFAIAYIMNPFATLLTALAVTLFAAFGLPVVKAWYDDWKVRREGR